MLAFLISVFVTSSLVFIFRFLNMKRNPPVFGIYQVRNKYYWIKFVFMYITLKIRQLSAYVKRLLDVEFGRSADGTVHVHQQEATLEQKYFLGDDPLAVDAVYLNAMSKDGEALICGIARRQGYFCDAFLMLKVNGEELLLTPALPDTRIKQETVEEGDFRAQGIEITNFIPMRTWKLLYNGEMKQRNNTAERIKVKIEMTWSAHFPPFNCDTQLSARSLATAIAKEPWSRNYFNSLKRLHQTHYEQMGYLKGTVTLDEQEYKLNMPCVRDHSFGPFRDWRTFHRYIMHFIYLENGDSINVGVVSQPAVLSHLTIGYYCRKSDQKVLSVDSCDLQLYQHGENQTMPIDYGFVFEAGGHNYAVQVKVNDEEPFYIGKDREAKFFERWSSVEVDGVKGWACVEWQYNNLTS